MHSEDKNQLKFLPIETRLKFGREAMRYKKSLTTMAPLPPSKLRVPNKLIVLTDSRPFGLLTGTGHN